MIRTNGKLKQGVDLDPATARSLGRHAYYAFRGDLVPTEAELARREGRAYETAAEMLERVRSER